MAITVVLQVIIRHKVVNLGLSRSEGVPGGDEDVPSNLVHSDETGEVAPGFGQHSSTYYALSESPRDVKGRKHTRSIELGLPKLQPFRTYASRTASHKLQHPPSEGSPL